MLTGIASTIPNGPYVGQYKLLAEYRKDEPPEEDIAPVPGPSAPRRVKPEEDSDGEDDAAMDVVA